MKIETITHIPESQNELKTLTSYYPTIIKGVLNDWPALNKWSWEYLENKFSEKIVDIFESKTSIFSFYGKGRFKTKKNISFRNAVRLIQNKPLGCKFYYLAMKSLKSDFPELVNDITLPKLVSSSNYSQTNIWCGSEGCITPIHFDEPNNFLCQLVGQKKVTLYAPSDLEFLYINQKKIYPHFSPIHTRKTASPKIYPRFSMANPIEITISEGDVLFIPPFWFHEVETIETSISINIWWPCNIDQTCVAPFIDRLIELHNTINVWEIFDTIDHNLDRDGLINYYQQRNISSVASILASHLIE